jgi:molecular chaperone DnaK (HSP70)
MSKLQDQAIKNRLELANIKLKYFKNEITREQAKKLAKPVLDRINKRSAEIAKKQGVRPIKLDFINAMRNSY